jgi:ataxin-10
VDCLAPLANAMFNRPAVCDQVVRLGGVAAVLAATRRGLYSC